VLAENSKFDKTYGKGGTKLLPRRCLAEGYVLDGKWGKEKHSSRQHSLRDSSCGVKFKWGLEERG